MNNKKVMPEDIDRELARTIWKGVATPLGTPSNIDLIRATLAWLANNPIEPTEEQAAHISRTWTYGAASRHGAIEFQRIAYLKKEDLLPRRIAEPND